MYAEDNTPEDFVVPTENTKKPEVRTSDVMFHNLTKNVDISLILNNRLFELKSV